MHRADVASYQSAHTKRTRKKTTPNEKFDLKTSGGQSQECDKTSQLCGRTHYIQTFCGPLGVCTRNFLITYIIISKQFVFILLLFKYLAASNITDAFDSQCVFVINNNVPQTKLQPYFFEDNRIVLCYFQCIFRVQYSLTCWSFSCCVSLQYQIIGFRELHFTFGTNKQIKSVARADPLDVKVIVHYAAMFRSKIYYDKSFYCFRFGFRVLARGTLIFVAFVFINLFIH